MKIPTTEGHVIDVEAPVLSAYVVSHKNVVRWWVWCGECRDWHTHGPGEGHREAPCADGKYARSGYNLALAGKMTRSVAAWVKRERTRDRHS